MSRNERLLIVDDDPNLRAMVQTWATRTGCVVRAVPGWREMSEVIPSYAPTTILLDLMMPEVDGIEVLNHLAESGCRARIVLMSGAESSLLEVAKRIAEAKKLVVAGILEKPIHLDVLQNLLG